MKKQTDELSKIDWRVFTPHPVVGVDEVGRGCLAGPVYAGAVIFKSDKYLDIVTDSKLLSEARRQEYAKLIEDEHLTGIGVATVEEIDELNILQASFLAMERAIGNLPEHPGHILVDGHMRISGLSHVFQTPIVKGDLRVSVISAASIIAKVARDNFMKELGVLYPAYGFETHKGYSTKAHKGAIALHGPCRWHRKSFSGVKEYLLGPEARPSF